MLFLLDMVIHRFEIMQSIHNKISAQLINLFTM